MFVVPLLNHYEIYAVTGTFYAINIGGLNIADPAVILQTVFAVGNLTVPILGAILFPALLALLFGRIWCGWMCPYHVVADAIEWTRVNLLKRLFKIDHAKSFPVAQSFTANSVRFGFLVLGIVLAGAIGIPVLNYVSAPGIISTEAMILVKEWMISLEFGFIIILALLELTILPRFWCRLFCPTGSCISVIRMPFTLRVANELQKIRKPCCKENFCASACPMGLQPALEADNLLCTNCARCIDACAAGNEVGRLHFHGFSTGRQFQKSRQ
jgi:ferredoxin-type protein NapH